MTSTFTVWHWTACRGGGDGVPTFVEVAAPTDDELHTLPQTLITRLITLLTRRGVLVEDMGQTYLATPDWYWAIRPDG